MRSQKKVNYRVKKSNKLRKNTIVGGRKKRKDKKASRKARKENKKGRGFFRFFEDKTINSCEIPVKKCSEIYDNCRKHYYFDQENSLYRPCRNPNNKYDSCRETAKTFNYKCIDRSDEKYKKDMDYLNIRIENEEKQNILDKSIRKQIGSILNYTVDTTGIRELQRLATPFPEKDLIEDMPEVNFNKFIKDFESEIQTTIVNPIDMEIESNRGIILDDAHIPILYKILKTVKTNKLLANNFSSMYNNYSGIESNKQFLEKYGNKKVIQQIEKQNKMRKLMERKSRERQQLIERERLEQEQKSREIQQLYAEADEAKPFSLEGRIPSEKRSNPRSNNESSIARNSLQRNQNIDSPKSSIASTVSTKYSLHGNKI